MIQVLIASPEDVHPEREIVTELISEWDSSYAQEQRVVLLPRRWETHSAPELGGPPQEIINRQVVDQSDIVVAIFWTRLGTPTLNSQSGTAEEIERAAQHGKLVMLYFSRGMADPDTLNLDELARLRAFRERMKTLGLVETYATLDDFRNKLRHQLDQQVRTLIATTTSGQHSRDQQDGLHLSLELESDTPANDGTIICNIVSCSDVDDIPILTDAERSDSDNEWIIGSLNRDYYRELVQYYIDSVRMIPMKLVVTNDGDSAFQDLRLEFRISDETVDIYDRLPTPPLRTSSFFGSGVTATLRPYGDEMFNDDGTFHVVAGDSSGRRFVAQWPVVQSGRRVVSPSFYISAKQSTKVEFGAVAYSSTTRPFTLSETIDVECREIVFTWRQILENAGIEVPD